MHSAAAHADLAAIAQQHAQALREVADRLGITVKVIDTPAEEQVGARACSAGTWRPSR